MKSKITAKFQTTIPKKIRERLKLSRNDLIEWEIDHGRVVVRPVEKPFLDFKGRFSIGRGDIEKDIDTTRIIIAKKAT